MGRACWLRDRGSEATMTTCRDVCRRDIDTGIFQINSSILKLNYVLRFASLDRVYARSQIFRARKVIRTQQQQIFVKVPSRGLQTPKTIVPSPCSAYRGPLLLSSFTSVQTTSSAPNPSSALRHDQLHCPRPSLPRANPFPSPLYS